MIPERFHFVWWPTWLQTLVGICLLIVLSPFLLAKIIIVKIKGSE